MGLETAAKLLWLRSYSSGMSHPSQRDVVSVLFLLVLPSRREVLSSLLEQFPAAKHFGADVLPIAIGQEVTLKDEWAGGSRGTLGPARLKVCGQAVTPLTTNARK